MDLSAGLAMVAIPGPTILPDAVRAALARPMPNIYDGPLIETAERLVARLPDIAQTSGRAFVAGGNGHAAWQMALSNTISPGDRVVVLESGRFAVLWGDYAAALGAEVEVIAGDFRSAVDPEALASRLADDDGSIRAVLVAHTDTSSSVRNDIAAVRTAMDQVGHDALLMVDCIASLGCEEYRMDEWGVDVTVAASQKGLMCPPGLGLVWANDRAIERYRSRSGQAVGYFDWGPRLEPRGFYDTFSGTPPVPLIHALDVALDLLEAEGGLEAVWARHEVLATAVRAAVAAWAAPEGIEFNITDPEHRSNAVTTVRTGSIDAEECRRRCEEHGGLTLGIGTIEAPGRSFRFGHMGHLNPPMILGTLATTEAALVSMDAPLGGSGVAAAAAEVAAGFSG